MFCNGEQNLPEQFVRGLSRASLEGRAQVVSDSSLGQQQNSNLGGLTFYLDGAHSPESLEVCAKWFSRVIREDPSHLEEQIHKKHHPGRVKSNLTSTCLTCLFIPF